MPARRIGSLFGTQYQNAAFAAVPPTLPAFSRIATRLPSQREKSAHGRPPPPPPHTTMSYSASNLSWSAAFADSVTAPRAAAAVPAPAALIKLRRDAAGGLFSSVMFVSRVFVFDRFVRKALTSSATTVA